MDFIFCSFISYVPSSVRKIQNQIRLPGRRHRLVGNPELITCGLPIGHLQGVHCFLGRLGARFIGSRALFPHKTLPPKHRLDTGDIQSSGSFDTFVQCLIRIPGRKSPLFFQAGAHNIGMALQGDKYIPGKGNLGPECIKIHFCPEQFAPAGPQRPIQHIVSVCILCKAFRQNLYLSPGRSVDGYGTDFGLLLRQFFGQHKPPGDKTVHPARLYFCHCFRGEYSRINL